MKTPSSNKIKSDHNGDSAHTDLISRHFMHFFGGHVVDAGSQGRLDGAGVAAVAFGALCDVVALLATLVVFL